MTVLPIVIVFLPCEQFSTDCNLDVSSVSSIIIFYSYPPVFLIFISQMRAEALE